MQIAILLTIVLFWGIMETMYKDKTELLNLIVKGDKIMKIKDEADIKLTDNVIVDATKKKLSKKKRNIIIVSVVVVTILLIILGWFLIERNANKWDIKQSEITIEYGEKYEPKLDELIDISKYPNVSNDNTRLEFSIQNEPEKEYPTTGTYDIDVKHKIQYKLFGLTLFSVDDKKTVKINIKDTTIPVFVEEEGFNPKEIEVYKDDKIENIKNKFKATDLSELDLSLDDSNVNYAVAGEYEAKIVAKDKSNNIAELEIKIKVIEPTISIEPASLELTVGEESDLKATVKGKNQDIEWSSSDNGIAKVENGKVTAVNKGTATITAKSNNVQSTSTVNVKEKPVTTTKPSATAPKNTTNPSTTKPNNNSGTTTQKPQTTTPNTTTPTQTQPYWCGEGGKHHVSEVGDIGWVSTYDIAVEKGRKLISEHGTGGRYLPEQCECGLWTCEVTFY